MPTTIKAGDKTRKAIAGRAKAGDRFVDSTGRETLLYSKVTRPTQGSFTKVTTMRSS